MTDPVKILVVAINGYGHYYLKTILEETDCDDAVLAGIIDPEAERSKYYPVFREFGIHISSTMNDFYLAGGKADLVVISSPPHYHVPQAILALHHGSNVLCEKPVSGVLSELESLIEKRDKTGRFVMVGFQWSYSEGIRSLKRDILNGRFGKPLRMKSLCMWPRTLGYFTRNSWAYRKNDPAGKPVMDNLFNNAMSHFIHNMLYLLGATENSSAGADRTEAVIARANDIESYDTGAFRAFTDRGTELLFLATHACERNVDPCFRIEFEKGFVELKPGAGEITARMINREVITYPSPDSDHQFRKLFEAIENVKTLGRISCPPEATLPHARIVNEIGMICGTPGKFRENLIVNDGERIFVKGLDDFLLSCYKDFRMPGRDLLNLRQTSL